MIGDNQTQQLLEGELLGNISDFLRALGNGTRLQITWYLSQGGLKSSELAAILQISPSAISHQLTLLKDLKVVSVRYEGKNQIYALADEHVSQVLDPVVEHYEKD